KHRHTCASTPAPRQAINPGAVINSGESREKRTSITPPRPSMFGVRCSAFDVRCSPSPSEPPCVHHVRLLPPPRTNSALPLPLRASRPPPRRRLPPLPTSPTTRQIERWTVRIDDRLLGHGDRDATALGDRAIKLLTARLLEISLVVPEKPLAKLRAVTIQLDL